MSQAQRESQALAERTGLAWECYGQSMQSWPAQAENLLPAVSHNSECLCEKLDPGASKFCASRSSLHLIRIHASQNASTIYQTKKYPMFA